MITAAADYMDKSSAAAIQHLCQCQIYATIYLAVV